MEKNSEEYNRILGELAGYCNESGKIDQNLYVNYDVKRGLRDSTGKGVLTGLTEISDVIGYDVVDGERVPTDGRLYYQGYNVEDLERGFHGSKLRRRYICCCLESFQMSSSSEVLWSLWSATESFRESSQEM